MWPSCFCSLSVCPLVSRSLTHLTLSVSPASSADLFTSSSSQLACLSLWLPSPRMCNTLVFSLGFPVQTLVFKCLFFVYHSFLSTVTIHHLKGPSWPSGGVLQAPASTLNPLSSRAVTFKPSVATQVSSTFEP